MDSPIPPPVTDPPPDPELALLILPEAAERGQSVDFLHGADTLLHIKPSAKLGVLVVNSFLAGRWGRQQRIAPPQGFDRPLTLRLRPRAGAVTLQLDSLPPVELALPAPLAAARLQLPMHILRLPSPGQHGLVHAQLLRADTQHATGLVQVAPPAAGAAPPLHLALTGDGQFLGRASLALPPASGAPVASQRFAIAHAARALVYEGMELSLWLEEEDAPRRLLDQLALHSRYLGAVEHASEREVRGWARNPLRPEQPLWVDVYVNERFQGSARASRPHRGEGPAQGHCGFLYSFPAPLSMTEGTDLRVAVRIRDSALELLHSPWWIGRAVALAGALPRRAPEPEAAP
ncbi:hypothetical protein [Pseudoroseomonas cervicalis]|uniref:hypothetical protein n=1 Tax=Teichococcus cervicalis TaxID=204525 RepID=UPI0022F19205|nr:hypothetical protein [Pseudoroseomonas cervicalis]WBV44545.1 hypothetical protein PFY06_08315 [Pseudoroseomonas cervicalis]